MITPQEKAKELVDKMLSKNPNRQDGISKIDTIQAKLCTLIAVDEILKLDYINDVFMSFSDTSLKDYYQQVKTEIEKL